MRSEALEVDGKVFKADVGERSPKWPTTSNGIIVIKIIKVKSINKNQGTRPPVFLCLN